MIVERLRPALIGDRKLDVSVVIDVLRATSTAIVLAARGVERLIVVATPAEIMRLEPPKNGRYLLFSEMSWIGGVADRVDNSPRIAQGVDLTGRIPVLVTTNGTRAIRAAVACSREVLLAGFLNIGAVNRYVQQNHPGRVSVLPAGDFLGAKPHFEDEQCATALEMQLRGEECDLLALATACEPDARNRKGIAPSGSGFTGDLKLCLIPDLYDTVPVARLDTSNPEAPIIVSPAPKTEAVVPAAIGA
jgi:phosphosulfolactate phosphohydrolase-like enzyme